MMILDSRSERADALQDYLYFAVEGVKGRPSMARQVQARLESIDGVLLASANPKTGTVVVFYEPQLITSQQLTARFHDLGCIQAPLPHRPSTLSQSRQTRLAPAVRRS